MAHFKFLLPIEIRGLFNGMVFKKRHGHSYISPRPRQYYKLKDKNSVFNQEQFRFISEFTTTVNKVKFIKDIWMQSYPKCYGSYQEIYKSNFRDFLYNDLTNKPKLTPGKGFNLKNPTVEIINSKISLTAEPLDQPTEVDGSKEKLLTSSALIIMRSAQSTGPGNFKISCHKGPNVLFNPESPINVEIQIGCLIDLININYIITQVYIFIATLDGKENPLRYSESISHLLPIPSHEVVDLVDSIGTCPV